MGEDRAAAQLRDEFAYYLANQDDLVAQYEGKVVVIKDKQVIGAYENELEAVTEASKKYELGTFLVQRCEPGEDSFVQMFHSRVVFV